MFCSYCGTQNGAGETFCKNCGYKLNNVTNNQPQTNETQQPAMNNYQNNPTNGGLDPSYVNNAVNPNMKKWAILSIIIPIVGMIWYWFIGLSFYVAILIAAAGFGFAQKGEMSNKKLAVAGKILNGMLCAMAVIMLIFTIIGIASGI